MIEPAKVAHIRDLLAQGLRIKDVMVKAGVSRNCVADIRDGISHRPTPLYDGFVAYEGQGKPRIRVKAIREPVYMPDIRESVSNKVFVPRSEGLIRVVIISDTHDDPNLEQCRFNHIGEFIKDTGPDVVCHTGDWAEFSFASRFSDRSSQDGREMSPFIDELDSLRSALDRLQTPMRHMSNPPRLVTTLGNHDERVWLYENAHAECEGLMWSKFMDALRDWEVHPYREWAFIGGVGFTHAPQSKLNRPFGGENIGRTIANKATFPVVFGHTHEPLFLHASKLGPDNKISVFNSGCAMPQGYVPEYAKGTGWGWSIGTLDILDGRIIGHSLIPMVELQRRYG